MGNETLKREALKYNPQIEKGVCVCLYTHFPFLFYLSPFIYKVKVIH